MRGIILPVLASILILTGLGFTDAFAADSDGDGFDDDDGSDNCPGIFNLNQRDYDLDGIGNVCDSSTDINSDITVSIDETIKAGQTWNLHSNTLTIANGVTLTNHGEFFDDGIIENFGTYDNFGNYGRMAPSGDFINNGVVNNYNEFSNVLCNAGILNNYGDFIFIEGGCFDGIITNNVEGSMAYYNYDFYGHGASDFTNHGLFIFEGPGTFENNGLITNTGTFITRDSYTNFNTIENSGTLDNQGTFENVEGEGIINNDCSGIIIGVIDGDPPINTCLFHVCGNGVFEGTEQCDDGNTISGDGCSDTCQIEYAPDTDGDGILDDIDACPFEDATGFDLDGDGCIDDSDGDGVFDNVDACPFEDATGQDLDGDGCIDSTVLTCGAGTIQQGTQCVSIPLDDLDGDGIPDDFDQCPYDPYKVLPGFAGCGVDETTDTDADGTPDYFDQCPLDPNKIVFGFAGCGVVEPALVSCATGTTLNIVTNQCEADPVPQVTCGAGTILVGNECLADVPSNIESVINSLVLQIQTLVDGDMLDEKDAKKSLKKLDEGLKKLEQGNKKACGEVEKFVKDVNKLVKKGDLASEKAQPLLDEADSLLAECPVKEKKDKDDD